MKIFDDMSYEDSNRFTVEDVVKALEMYNENFVTFPRADIAKYSGIPIPSNKRNWRKQDEHLQWCRIIQKANDEVDGTDWRSGNGRPSKEQTIRDYMIAHPEVRKKTEIAEALKINRHTVGKYYDMIRAEIDQQRREEEPQRRVVVENGRLRVKVVPSPELLEKGIKAFEFDFEGCEE